MPHTPTAGDLRDTVAIEELETPAEADANGQPKEVWRRIAVRRACVRPLTGGELWRGKQQESEANVAVDLRFFARLTRYRGGVAQGPLMRLVELDGRGEDVRVLNVSSVINEDGKRIWTTCLCKA